MKFLLVVALVAGVRAEAEAEADPQLLVAGSPLLYGLGAHHAVVHTPVVKSVEVKPAEVKTAVTAPVVTYTAGYPYAAYPYAGVYGHGLGLGYGLWGHGLPIVGAPAAAAEAEAPAVEAEARKKREAEAEADPEADPYYLTYGLHHPIVYTAPVVKAAEVKTVEVKAPAVTYAYNHGLYPYSYGYHGVPYAGVYGAYPYSYGYPYYHVATPAAAAAEEPAVDAERKKREAEADPAVLASYTTVKNAAPVTYTLPYATHGVYAGYPYAAAGYAAAGYPYHTGVYGAGLYGAGVYGAGLGYGLVGR